MLRFDVFGYRIGVIRESGEWHAYLLGQEGKHRAASFVHIPSWIEEEGLPRFLGDLFHEAATPERPEVVRLDPPSSQGPDEP